MSTEPHTPAKPLYTVIENTPGYLPDDDDPPTFDSYAEALNYLAEYHKELWHEVDGDDSGIALYDVSPIVNGYFTYTQLNTMHGLHRNVSIEALEGNDD